MGSDAAESVRLGKVPYEGLLCRLFSNPSRDADEGFVIALTASHARAGVSHVTRSIARELGEDTGDATIALHYDGLLALDPTNKDRAPEIIQQEHLSARGNWRAAQHRISTSVTLLRQRYRYVLIDTPSLKEGSQALSIAPLVDGTILVVEANRTKRDQIAYAEQAIRAAKGRLLGLILNKRTYPIPQRLHAKLESLGV